MVKGRPIPLPSKKYRQYERQAGEFLEPLNIDYPINLKCLFYMPTKRRVDLPNLLNAICDTLEKHNVIIDDNRNIVYSADGSRVLWDKENPRTEIEISKMPKEEFQSWKK